METFNSEASRMLLRRNFYLIQFIDGPLAGKHTYSKEMRDTIKVDEYSYYWIVSHRNKAHQYRYYEEQ